MKISLYTLFTLFCSLSIYGQYDANCIGYPGIHDYPEQLITFDDSTFLVIHKRISTTDSSLHLTKLSASNETLWTKKYDVKNPMFLSADRYNDKIVVVGTAYIGWYDFTPFLLILSEEGVLIEKYEFPEVEDCGYSNATALVLADSSVFFGVENKIYGLDSNNEIEMVFDGGAINLQNIKSFKQSEDNEWLLYCRFPWVNHTILRLDENFEEIARIDLGGVVDYFDIEKVYWDSHERLHIIGLDHWDFNNPPIWKIATFNVNGDLLWIKDIHHGTMNCSFLGSIKEYDNGYYLFGISEVGNENPSYLSTMYQFTFDGDLVSYFYLEGLGSSYGIGSQDFYVRPNGASFFLAGYSDCNQVGEETSEIKWVETFTLELSTIPEDLISSTEEIRTNLASVISVYPTVFTNAVKIESSKIITEVRIYDLLGRCLFTQKSSGQQEMVLTNFVNTPEVYLLMAEFEDHTKEVVKIVKQK